MRLILHHALKDLRAQKWLLAAWAAALVATGVIEAFELDVHFTGIAGREASVSLLYLLASLALARVVLGWVLAIRYVHADPAEGTDAFWLTRPISRRALLAAKAAAVGVLLLVPGIVATLVFVMNGVPWSVLPAAVAGWLLIEAVFLLPLALVATMTRDLARMVLGVLGAAAGWVVVQGVSTAWVVAPVEAFRGTRSAWLLLAVCIVLASLLLASRQYLSRRTAQTAIVGAGVLAALVLVAGVWPVRALLTRGEQAEPPTWNRASSVSISIPPDSVRVRSAEYVRAGTRDTRSFVVSGLLAEGLAGDTLVNFVSGRGSFEAGGVTGPTSKGVYGSGFGFFAGGLLDPASRSHFELAIGTKLLARSAAVGPWIQLFGFATTAEYSRFQGRPSVYEAAAKLEALRIASVSAMPVSPGASSFASGVETSILAVRRDRGPADRPSPRYTILLRRAAPRAWLARRPSRVECVIRNRRRGEAMIVWSGMLARAMPTLTGSFLVTMPGAAQFDAAHALGEFDEAWLADAELVIVELEPLGEFEKTIRIENLTLPGTQ